MPWGGWQRGGGCIRDVKDVGSNSLRGRWGGPRGNAWWVLFPVCVSGGVSPVPCIPLAAKVRNRQGCGIPCLLLPPTPLAWGWDASSRVSSGRNQGWLEEEAELQERNARTDGRVDRRSPGGMANTRLLLCLQLWLWVQGSAQELDPNGRNVCKVGR